MKYFIDFEATQFSNEIISVGAVREDGQTFYSLVAPVKGKVTPFITNLTGITSEMVEEALSANSVFESFYDWAFNDDTLPKFIVWGSSDKDFLQGTFEHTTTIKARMVIGYIRTALVDYEREFCVTFGLEKSFALLKALQCFEPDATQNHNALDDAVMLQKVYNYFTTQPVEDMTRYLHETFPNKVKARLRTAEVGRDHWTNLGLPTGTICMVTKSGACVEHWENVDEAAQWVINNLISPKGRGEAKVENVRKSINKFVHNGKKYFCRFWRKVQ